MSRWNYANSATSSHGLMKCHACSQLIVGDYRYREGRDGFILNHRSCSSDDKVWGHRDAELKQYQARLEEQLKAYKAFRDYWNEDALNEEIANLEKHLSYLVD